MKLKIIPEYLRDQLIEEYREIKRKYILNEWAPGELNAGRFAEVLLRIFQFLLGDEVTPFGTEITSSEKNKLINKVTNISTINEHLRQKTTVLCRLLLDFRNNRDVAHIGGFNANHMDANFMMSCAKWILCEMIRVFGDYSMDESESIVDDINIKEFPTIIEINGEQFITKPDLTSEQEILILLYKNTDGVDYDFIFAKTKDDNQSRFKKRLISMQKKKMITSNQNRYFIMPLGIKIAEESDLLK